MDYSTFKTDLATHLNRSDMTAKIPTFVDLAIRTLEQNCFWFQMTQATLTAASGVGYVSLPSDFIREAQGGMLDPNYAQMRKSNYAEIYAAQLYGGDSGEPSVYAIADKVYLYPIPDSTHSLTLSYYRHIGAPASDTGTAGTNAWTVDVWDLTFWETLEQAWRHIGDAEEQMKANAEKTRLLSQYRSRSGRLTGRGQVRYVEF